MTFVQAMLSDIFFPVCGKLFFFAFDCVASSWWFDTYRIIGGVACFTISVFFCLSDSFTALVYCFLMGALQPKEKLQREVQKLKHHNFFSSRQTVIPFVVLQPCFFSPFLRSIVVSKHCYISLIH